VHDPIHTVLNVAQQVIGQVRQESQHAEDVTKYATMIQKQVQQINQMTTMINQNVEQMRRFGNPNTYINMLGLDELFSEVNKIESGVGRTVSEFRQTANGIAALKNSGEGLYRDLTSLPDRFGQQVRYQADAFKQFGVVQNMFEDYNHQLSQLNDSIGRLESDARATAQQINSAGSLVETQKLVAKHQALQGMVDANFNKATLSALKVLVQGEANRNDQARVQAAARQRQAQENAIENAQLRALGAQMLAPAAR
jgi:chromosome segregation ATPase